MKNITQNGIDKDIITIMELNYGKSQFEER